MAGPVTYASVSSVLPRVIDTVQEETQQGPCLTSAFDELTVRVADMATETRWPLFAARAAEAGAASMLSIQLYVEQTISVPSI